MVLIEKLNDFGIFAHLTSNIQITIMFVVVEEFYCGLFCPTKVTYWKLESLIYDYVAMLIHCSRLPSAETLKEMES